MENHPINRQCNSRSRETRYSFHHRLSILDPFQVIGLRPCSPFLLIGMTANFCCTKTTLIMNLYFCGFYHGRMIPNHVETTRRSPPFGETFMGGEDCYSSDSRLDGPVPVGVQHRTSLQHGYHDHTIPVAWVASPPWPGPGEVRSGRIVSFRPDERNRTSTMDRGRGSPPWPMGEIKPRSKRTPSDGPITRMSPWSIGTCPHGNRKRIV